MLDIYDADGHLDRERVLDKLDDILRDAPGITKAVRDRLADLLDECSEGYAHNPLDSPTMVTEHINVCRRVR